MKNKSKVALGTLAIFSILSFSSLAGADDSFISMAPLIGEVNAGSPGVEFIMPHFIAVDANNDGVAEQMSFKNDISANNSKNKLYSSKKRTADYPDITPLCTDPLWAESYPNPIFVRSGKWMVTGVQMISECYSATEGDQDAENAFIYIADVSAQGGTVKTVKMDGTSLIGLDLVDADGNGTEDLMISVIIEQETRDLARVYFMDLESQQVISNNLFNVSQH